MQIISPTSTTIKKKNSETSKPWSITSSSSSYPLSSSSFIVIGVVGIIASMIMGSSFFSSTHKDPYYFSSSSSDLFIPVSLVYTILSHIWVFGILGKRNIVTPLPPPPLPVSLPLLPPSSVESTTTTTTTTVTTTSPTKRAAREKKVAIVTGSNTGIGFETARRLVVEYGWDVILACRSTDKALRARDIINGEQQQQKQQGQEQQQEDDDVVSPAVHRDDDHNSNNMIGRAIVIDDTMPLDLSDYTSIRSFAQSVIDKYDRIDALINNAGRNTSGKSTNNNIRATKRTRRKKEEGGGDDDDENDDGNPSSVNVDLDLMFQSNYLGHFLLTELLLDKLRDGGKVVNLSSVMHHFCGGGGGGGGGGGARSDDDDDNDNDVGGSTTRTNTVLSPTFWRTRALYHDPNSDTVVPGVYSASKLAAILHSLELNRRYGTSHGIFSIAVNPGSVNSDIWRGFPSWVRKIFQFVYLTPQQGSTPLVAATVIGSDEWAKDGVQYLQPYWVPSSSTSSSSLPPMWPFQEMLGPYVGYTPTTPRLPGTESEILEASQALWTVSEELTSPIMYK